MTSPINDDESMKSIYLEILNEIIEETYQRLITQDDPIDKEAPEEM